MFKDLNISFSITANSNREWIKRHEVRVRRYLREHHNRLDWDLVLMLLHWYFPEEGKKLVENYDLSDEEKINLFLDYLIDSRIYRSPVS